MTETLTTLGSLALTGFLVSGAAQFFKAYFDKTSHKVLLVVGLSVVGGAILYTFKFVPENFVTVIVSVWAAANSVYLILSSFIKQ